MTSYIADYSSLKHAASVLCTAAVLFMHHWHRSWLHSS